MVALKIGDNGVSLYRKLETLALASQISHKTLEEIAETSVASTAVMAATVSVAANQVVSAQVLVPLI